MQIIILKKFFEKKQDDGNVKQFCSIRSFLQKSMSSVMSLNSLISIPTIMYIAAEVLIGLIPLMFNNLSNAASAAVFNFNLRSVKNDSGTVPRILGNAC